MRMSQRRPGRSARRGRQAERHMRKSRPTTAKRGNVRKADSFKEAWSRINHATKSGFYLEAAAIQESIIFDRLLAYLHRTCDFPLMTARNRHHSLSDLIKQLRKTVMASQNAEMLELASELDTWRETRNRTIHSIVRSAPGTPTQAVDDFLARAKACAVSGAKLARRVSRLRSGKRADIRG